MNLRNWRGSRPPTVSDSHRRLTSAYAYSPLTLSSARAPPRPHQPPPRAFRSPPTNPVRLLPFPSPLSYPPPAMDQKLDDAKSSAEATVEEMLASRLSVSSISISGAQRTSRDLLDRITLPVLSTGGTFSSVVEDVSAAVDLLRSTNCFRGVDAFLDTQSSDSGATASFTLSEKSLYQLHTGTTIDTSPGARRDPTLEASLVWRNVTGQADSLKGAVSWMGGSEGEPFAARPTTRFNLDYRRPFALGLRLGLFSALSSSMHNHEYNSSHSLALKTACAGIEHPHGRFSVNAAWRHVLDVTDRASPIVHNDAGHSWKTSVQEALEVDNRDSRRMPTQGDCVSLTAEATLPIGDVRFLKVDTAYQTHLPLGASGVSASFISRAGVLLSDQRTNIIDRFYLGGPTSLRGFQNRGVGPRDSNDAIGGDAYYTLGAMLSIPMPESSLLSQLFNARMHVFGVVGDLTDVPTARAAFENLLAKTPVKDRVRATWKEVYRSMRVSTGLGIAIETAVGRVEANYCRVLHSAESDIASSGFQFGISESFS